MVAVVVDVNNVETEKGYCIATVGQVGPVRSEAAIGEVVGIRADYLTEGDVERVPAAHHDFRDAVTVKISSNHAVGGSTATVYRIPVRNAGVEVRFVGPGLETGPDITINRDDPPVVTGVVAVVAEHHFLGTIAIDVLDDDLLLTPAVRGIGHFVDCGWLHAVVVIGTSVLENVKANRVGRSIRIATATKKVHFAEAIAIHVAARNGATVVGGCINIKVRRGVNPLPHVRSNGLDDVDASTTGVVRYQHFLHAVAIQVKRTNHCSCAGMSGCVCSLSVLCHGDGPRIICALTESVSCKQEGRDHQKTRNSSHGASK